MKRGKSVEPLQFASLGTDSACIVYDVHLRSVEACARLQIRHDSEPDEESFGVAEVVCHISEVEAGYLCSRNAGVVFPYFVWVGSEAPVFGCPISVVFLAMRAYGKSAGFFAVDFHLIHFPWPFTVELF